MPFFIIHGFPSCPNFGHAIVVAQYLSKKLPDFQFKKVEVAQSEWGEHLMEINRKTKWYVMKSPLIWKEIHQWGGKKYLIGGLGEFWEYVYCYYGLESRIPKAELRNLAEENTKFFEEKEHEAAERMKYVRIISILGASNLMTTLLLHDLFDLPILRKRDGIIVRLYDECAYEPRKRKVMEDTTDYYNSLSIFGKEPSVSIVNTVREALCDCNLLLIIEDFRPLPGQDEETSLEKCFARMNCLSEDINASRHHGLRVVVASEGPSCFLASCLIEFITTVKSSNIVVLAADHGLSYIRLLSEKTGIPVSRISAPPVWGAIGMSSFVDEKMTVFKADVYRPNTRSLTAPRGSTLPLGTIKSELRLMSYLLRDHEEIGRVVEERKKKISKSLERPAVWGKIRALINLVKLWYAEYPSDEIISLGVSSNGSFNIPGGIVFAQPVMLDSQSRWVPYTEYPLINDNTRKNIANSVEVTSKVLKKFGLLHYICKDDIDVCSNRDCPMNIIDIE